MKTNIQQKFRFFSTLLAFVLTCSIFSQVKNLPNSAPVNQENKSSLEKQLEMQLDEARTSNNTVSAKQMQARLDILQGHSQIYQPPLAINHGDYRGYQESQGDFITNMIHSNSLFAHALGMAPAGSPIAGRQFYMIAQNSQSGADSLRLIYSTNNGASWLLGYWQSMGDLIFNNDQLDIEVVYDGTNTWIFGVAGVTDPSDGRKKIFFFRKNITTLAYYLTLLNFPGSGPGMNYYNPRITSDNTNYTANAHVMITCSMDSLAGTNHWLKQKYVLFSSPFDSIPSLNYTQPAGSYGLGWIVNAGTNTNVTIKGDIAYYKNDGGTGENRVMTVITFNGLGGAANNIYVTYVNNYTTLGGAFFLRETSINKDVKLVFNGGTNIRTGAITYLKHRSANNWDIFGFRTTNGGSDSTSWTRDSAEYTPYYSRTCDLVAVRNEANQFKLTFAMDFAGVPQAVYKSFNGTSWSNGFQYNLIGVQVDTIYAKPKAGYIPGGGDNGAGIWSNLGGQYGYFVKQIFTTTGLTSNNEVPSGFSLSQNYPNPFNPVTNIKFSIPKAGMVKLIVYDITGKEIAPLINQDLNAGSYTYDFDASHLSSGAYFYRLTADGFTDVKKMMLVK